MKQQTKLGQLRDEVNVSQSELAKALGMSKQQLSGIEREERRLRLTPEQYAVLLDILDISPWELVQRLQ